MGFGSLKSDTFSTCDRAASETGDMQRHKERYEWAFKMQKQYKENAAAASSSD